MPIAGSIDAVANGFPSSAFTDAGIYALVFTELVLATTALLILRARGYELAPLLPHPTLRGCVVGVILAFVAALGANIITLPFGPEGMAPAQQMLEESRLSLGAIILLAMVNGPFEEVFLLAVLTDGLRRHGASIALGVPLLVRVSYHLYQGPTAALWVGVFGLVLALYWLRYRQLWPPVFAHILWDIVPFVGLAD